MGRWSAGWGTLISHVPPAHGSNKGVCPPAGLARPLQDPLSIISESAAGAGELGRFVTKIAKWSLAPLGVTPCVAWEALCHLIFLIFLD